MTNPESSDDATAARPAIGRRHGRNVIVAAGILGAFVVGAGGATLAARHRQPAIIALTPAPIATLKNGTAVALKGQVAEVFGNKFVVQDDSGRALVETGPAGDSGTRVAKSEPVTVQGRFDDGFLHAMVITHGDGRTVIVGPPGPGPRRGRTAPDGRDPSRGGDRPSVPQADVVR